MNLQCGLFADFNGNTCILHWQSGTRKRNWAHYWKIYLNTFFLELLKKDYLNQHFLIELLFVKSMFSFLDPKSNFFTKNFWKILLKTIKYSKFHIAKRATIQQYPINSAVQSVCWAHILLCFAWVFFKKRKQRIHAKITTNIAISPDERMIITVVSTIFC